MRSSANARADSPPLARPATLSSCLERVNLLHVSGYPGERRGEIGLSEGHTLRIGERIVVRTPDRREYRGVLVETRMSATGRREAVVRLDTGWLTTYPLEMVDSLHAPRGNA